MSRAVIVRMGPEHLDALAELERICFSRPWSRKELEAELDNSCARFFAAVLDGKVVGYAGMHCAAGECYLDNVAVLPEHRRQGIAGELLDTLEAEARALGGEFLSLEVRASNAGAIALYEGKGFREEGRRKDFYGAPRGDGLILTKRF